MSMTNKSRMNLIMGLIGLKRLQLLAPELGKFAELDFVYTLASTDSNHQHRTWSKCV